MLQRLTEAPVQFAELFPVSCILVTPVLTLYCLESLFNKVRLNSRLFVSVLVCSVLMEIPQHPAPTNLIICALNHPANKYGSSAETVTMFVTR